MALSNRQRISLGLDELKSVLQPWVEDVLSQASEGPRKREAELAIEECELRVVDGAIQWDIQGLLRVMIKLWGALFSPSFDRHERSHIRSLVQEANHVRNRFAHEVPFSYEDTYRDLDNLARVADAINEKEVALKLREMAKTVMRVQFQEEARVDVRKAATMEGTPLAALKPWREVIVPHSDVAKGNFLESEFVADLHAVHVGEATAEYGKPVDFFARTFLTDGLQDLLSRALIRLTGKGGSPVIELKTNFGGGKTHSLLALYHLFSDTPSTLLSGMDPLLQKTGITNAPSAKRVVIAGHQLGVNQPRNKEDGTTVNTLWGELAWQLGGAEAYEKIRSSDESGTNPGAEVLAQLMRDAGPCLILLDEWVAYLRETIDQDIKLAGGSFESNFGFAQSLTEAAKVVPTALVVASLPASRIEMGGPNGEAAFTQLSNLFQRVATPWQPTRTEEGYEIVRRRLFDSQIDYPARDAVVKAFYELYSSKRGNFPSNTSEQEYRRKLEACYPIHPELFDKLDAVWSTLEKFQKTRGVLRFMAAVISELWQRDDKNLVIMPASVPLDSGRVTNIINEVLPSGGNWASVISSDIDGQAAAAQVIDSDNSGLGKYSACRRVARSIFMAATPTHGANRGVDDEHMLLACVQPGENPEKFGDALRRLADKATYLYRDSSRSWFALQPSITRLAADRTKDFRESDDLDDEIIKALRKWEGRSVFPSGAQFARIPADIPDEIGTRLIILPPSSAASKNPTNCKAEILAEELLLQSANKPRTHRNGLFFLAADETHLSRLRDTTASWLAWKSIKQDEESLELGNHDKNQVATRVTEYQNTMATVMGDSWSKVLVPRVKDPTSNQLSWDRIDCPGKGDKVRAALKALQGKDLVYHQFSAFHLERELKRYLWGQRDHVTTRDVSNAFGTYLYLPVLLTQDLLIEAIQSGFSNDSLLCEFFGYADAFDEDEERYQGLSTTKPPAFISLGESVLVKRDIAMSQTDPVKPSPAGGDTPSTTSTGETTPGGPTNPPPDTPTEQPKTRFFGSVELDPLKVSSSSQKVVDEVLQHLSAIYGSKVKVTLEIEVENENGFDETTRRVVSENSRTLGFREGEFD